MDERAVGLAAAPAEERTSSVPADCIFCLTSGVDHIGPRSILKKHHPSSQDYDQHGSSLSEKTERWLREKFDITVDIKRVNRSWSDKTQALTSSLRSLIAGEDPHPHQENHQSPSPTSCSPPAQPCPTDDIEHQSHDSLTEKKVRFSLPNLNEETESINDTSAGIDKDGNQFTSKRSICIYTARDIYAYYLLSCQKRRVQPVQIIMDTLLVANSAMASASDISSNEKNTTNTNLKSTTTTNEAVISTQPIYLHLKGHQLSGADLLSISDFLGLEFGLHELTLDDVDLTDETTKSILSHLYHINSLPWLSLANNSKIGHAGVRYISSFVRKMSAIRCLDLSGIALDDQDAVHNLADALAVGPDKLGSTLQVLKLDNCKLKNDGLGILANGIRHSNLHTLTLCYNRIDPIGAAAVAKLFLLPDDQVIHSHKSSSDTTDGMTAVSSTNIHDDAYARDVVQGKRARGLVVLDLQHNSIKHGVLFMAEAMTKSTHIRRLFLSHNSIPPQGLTSLAKSLAVNATLHELDLSHNPIAKDYIEGIAELKYAMTQNTALRTLNLASCDLTSHEIIQLCDALPFMTGLVQLNLINNHIDMACLMALSAALSDNHSLISIELGHIPANEGYDECVRFADEIQNVCLRNREEMIQKDTAVKQLMQTRALHELLNSAQSNSQLFEEMLAEVETPSSVDSNTKEVLEQLYKNCREVHEKLLQHASSVEAEDVLHIILTVNDALIHLLARYTTLFPLPMPPILASNPTDGLATITSAATNTIDSGDEGTASVIDSINHQVDLANIPAPLREDVRDAKEMLLVKRKNFEDEEGEALRVAQEEAEQQTKAETEAKAEEAAEVESIVDKMSLEDDKLISQEIRKSVIS